MTIFVDAGPLVALLDRRDRHHDWVRNMLDTIQPPIFTCEPVLTEACFLLKRLRGGQDAILELLAKQLVACEFRLQTELAPIRNLMRKFADVPMSLADACLVRMTELDAHAVVLTLDGDFHIYRRNRRQIVPSIMPG